MKLTRVIGMGLLLLLGIAACQSENQLEYDRYYAAGSLVYQTRCQNCHAAKGEGLQNLIPPLTDSAYLKINRPMLTCFIKNGLKGKIYVSGRLFEGAMPAVELSPVETAEVLTFTCNSFGNSLGLISSQQVEQDLKNCQ